VKNINVKQFKVDKTFYIFENQKEKITRSEQIDVLNSSLRPKACISIKLAIIEPIQLD
jgi:hypothetical protein